jgi:hypothetical protein
MTTTNVPARPSTSSSVTVSEVCHVCHRGLIGPSDGSTWSVACARCRRIDRRLGQEYGLTQCTPLWGAAPGVPRPSLHGTLMRGPSFEHALDALRWHHTRRTLALASSDASADLLEVPGDDVDDARITDWGAWQAAHPATDDAVAAAYQDFVRTVHPWVDSVEPRVDDRAWLVGLLADRRSAGSPWAPVRRW